MLGVGLTVGSDVEKVGGTNATSEILNEMPEGIYFALSEGHFLLAAFVPYS